MLGRTSRFAAVLGLLAVACGGGRASDDRGDVAVPVDGAGDTSATDAVVQPGDGGDGNADIAATDAVTTDATTTDVAATDGGVPDGTNADRPPPVLLSGCSDDGWCWMAPLPQGNRLARVWASSATDVWAVGDLGSIVHYDGVAWRAMKSGTLTNLYDVHGTGPTDVWAVGLSGTILHYAGDAWVKSTSGTTNHVSDVWAVAPDDVWAAAGATLLHWNGSTWSAMRPPTVAPTGLFVTVWASGPKDVWATTDFGPVHYDGSTWTSPDSSAGKNSMWGRAADDVWIAWDGLAHYTGQKWMAVTVPYSDPTYWVTGNAAGDIWTTSSSVLTLTPTTHLLRGGVWRDMPLPFTITSLWSTGPDDTWAVGPAGLIDRWDGQRWEPPIADPAMRRDYLSGFGPDDVWAVGVLGQVTHFTGAEATVGRIDGTDSSTRINAFYAVAPNDLWAVGNAGAVFHGDGTTWRRENLGTTNTLYTVWGSSPNDVWIGGTNGTLLRYDGTTWKPSSPSSTSYIYGVGGWGANDVWVLGSGRLLTHFDGARWTTPDLSASSSTEIFRHVSGSGPTDVWISGSYFYRLDATKNALVRMTPPNDTQRGHLWNNVNYVRGVAPNDLWMLSGGDNEAVAHWDGQRFDAIPEIGTRTGFASLWVAKNGDVWIAGGPVLRRRASPP